MRTWRQNCSRYSGQTSEDRRCSASSAGASSALASRILTIATRTLLRGLLLYAPEQLRPGPAAGSDDAILRARTVALTSPLHDLVRVFGALTLQRERAPALKRSELVSRLQEWSRVGEMQVVDWFVGAAPFIADCGAQARACRSARLPSLEDP